MTDIEQKLRRLCELEPETFSFRDGEPWLSVPHKLKWKDRDWQWAIAGYCLEQMQERWKEFGAMPIEELVALEPLMHMEARTLTPSLILDYYVRWRETQLIKETVGDGQ
jgi:hypothetical protein